MLTCSLFSPEPVEISIVISVSATVIWYYLIRCFICRYSGLKVWMFANGREGRGTLKTLLLDVLIVFECMEVFTQ